MFSCRSQASGIVCVLLTTSFSIPGTLQKAVHMCWVIRTSGIDSEVYAAELGVSLATGKWVSSIMRTDPHVVNHCCPLRSALILWLMCLCCLASELSNGAMKTSIDKTTQGTAYSNHGGGKESSFAQILLEELYKCSGRLCCLGKGCAVNVVYLKTENTMIHIS